MSTDHDGGGGHEQESSMWNIGGWLHKAADVAMTAGGSLLESGVGKEAAHALAGGLNPVLGPIGVALGLKEMSHAKKEGDGIAYGIGTAEAAGGALTTIEGLASLVSLAAHGTATGAAATSVAGAAGAGAAIAGGAAIGGTAGYGMAKAADSQLGHDAMLFGTDPATGKARSAYDVTAGWGTSAKDWVDGKVGSKDSAAGWATGGLVSGVTGIGAGVVGAADAAGRWLFGK